MIGKYSKLMIVEIIEYKGHHLVVDDSEESFYELLEFLADHRIHSLQLTVTLEVVRYCPKTFEYILGA